MENIDDLKLKLLQMFQWFHSICVENNLRYYAIGGTMLGAARHKGFIPWDDDIDVGMPREDYNKLIELINSINDNRYILETPNKNNKDYLYSYAKLYDTNTTLIEHTRYKIKRGIFIDIFPLDGVGNTKTESINNFKKVLPYLNFLAMRSCAFRKERKFYKNFAILLCRLIPNFLYSNSKLLNKINILCTKYSFDECDFIANFDGNWRYKEIVEKRAFGKPKIYDFEGLKIYGVEDYDLYLTTVYGDWRKLPPKEKQVTHHDFILLDLSKSYLDK